MLLIIYVFLLLSVKMKKVYESDFFERDREAEEAFWLLKGGMREKSNH